jgi:hypothetical protein
VDRQCRESRSGPRLALRCGALIVLGAAMTLGGCDQASAGRSQVGDGLRLEYRAHAPDMSGAPRPHLQRIDLLMSDTQGSVAMPDPAVGLNAFSLGLPHLHAFAPMTPTVIQGGLSHSRDVLLPDAAPHRLTFWARLAGGRHKAIAAVFAFPGPPALSEGPSHHPI